MKYPLYLFAILFSLYSCNSEKPKQQWVKGNLHTHTLWSDGDDFPEMVLKWYKDHNYQFIALSDHNTIADKERWYRLKDRELKNNTLEKYQKEFGDWVEVRYAPDSTEVKLKTYNEYKTKLETPGAFVVIKSEEVTSGFEKKPVHINVSNIEEYIAPVKGTSVLDIMQQTIDNVYEQRQKTNTPMFAHINHPNFGYGVSVDDLKALNGERFFEVYNGHPAVNNDGDAMHIGVEKMWDEINIYYHSQGKPLLLGIATDDSHHYHAKSTTLSNSGRGWVMVESSVIGTNELILAMEAGHFYASSGIELSTAYHTDKSYTIAVEAQNDAEYEIIFYGYKTNGASVVELSRTKGTSASYDFKSDDVFVRAKIISIQKIENPYAEGETAQAWTQPIVVK